MVDRSAGNVIACVSEDDANATAEPRNRPEISPLSVREYIGISLTVKIRWRPNGVFNLRWSTFVRCFDAGVNAAKQNPDSGFTVGVYQVPKVGAQDNVWAVSPQVKWWVKSLLTI